MERPQDVLSVTLSFLDIELNATQRTLVMAAITSQFFSKAVRPARNLKVARGPLSFKTCHLNTSLSRVSLNYLQKMPLVGLLSLIGASEVLITMATPREPIRRQVTINQSIQEA